MGDGVGSCTGTSMAAPHITALAGLVVSINPLLLANDVRNIIRQSGNLQASPVKTDALGWGLPSAAKAVKQAMATNKKLLTPLFSFYSNGRADSFYTTVPNMSRSATYGTMYPQALPSTQVNNAYVANYGNWVSGYQLPQVGPSFGGGPSLNVKAEVWVFTTDANPKSATDKLSALYRMSWKCSDPTPYPHAVCAATDKPGHVDSVLVTKAELDVFGTGTYAGGYPGFGYRLDGIEGFIYPKTSAQPPGTVRLMRMYSPERDDHAIFPETELNTMSSQGYTTYSGYTNWLGYVYPNTTGAMPTIQ
jgi:hypothetical protein